jgi:toxin CcdB
VQSSLFDAYRRRLVVPLVLRSSLPAGAKVAGTRLNPVFKIKGQTLVLHPLDMVSVAINQLGPCVASLADRGQTIADALDELLTRSWG